MTALTLYEDGWTYEQIGRLFRRDRRHVEKWLFRAKVQLRRLCSKPIDGDNLLSPVDALAGLNPPRRDSTGTGRQGLVGGSFCRYAPAMLILDSARPLTRFQLRLLRVIRTGPLRVTELRRYFEDGLHRDELLQDPGPLRGTEPREQTPPVPHPPGDPLPLTAVLPREPPVMQDQRPRIVAPRLLRPRAA